MIPIRTELESYAFSLIRNKEEVDDVLQEVYIRLWCMREKLNEYRSINALSFVITKNLCINKIKARKRLIGYDAASECRSECQQADAELIEKEDLQHVLGIIERLPSLQQTILKMRHIEGLEIEEIAEITGCAEGAVRTNLSRARNRVRTLFMKGEEDETYIRRLIEDFFDGKTSIGEEKELYEYFSGEVVAESLQRYKSIFQYFEGEICGEISALNDNLHIEEKPQPSVLKIMILYTKNLLQLAPKMRKKHMK